MKREKKTTPFKRFKKCLLFNSSVNFQNVCLNIVNKKEQPSKYCRTYKYISYRWNKGTTQVKSECLAVSLHITITFNHPILCSHLKMLCIECIESEKTKKKQMKTIVIKWRCCTVIIIITISLLIFRCNFIMSISITWNVLKVAATKPRNRILGNLQAHLNGQRIQYYIHVLSSRTLYRPLYAFCANFTWRKFVALARKCQTK